MSGYVYMLANRNNGRPYTGVTNDLVRRVNEHKSKAVDGFSKQYDVNNIVNFEQHPTRPNAIQREKNIEHQSRKWKLDLIEKDNLNWYDLYDQLI